MAEMIRKIEEFRACFTGNSWMLLTSALRKWMETETNPHYEIISDSFKDIYQDCMKINEEYSYYYLCGIAEILSTRHKTSSSQPIAPIVEPYIVPLLDATIRVWKAEKKSLKKYKESLLKMLKAWDSRRLFPRVPIDRYYRQLEILVEESNYIEVTEEDKSNNIFKCCTVMNIVYEDLSTNLTADCPVLLTGCELIHTIIHRIDVPEEELTVFALGAYYLTRKLWWDTIGYISVKSINRCYWKYIHVNEDLKMSLSNTEESYKIICDYIFEYEMKSLLALGFSFDVNSTSRLFAKRKLLMNSLYISEDQQNVVEAFVKSAPFAVSKYSRMEDIKSSYFLAIVMALAPATETVKEWLALTKVDEKVVDDGISHLRVVDERWKTQVHPLLEALRDKKNRSQLKNLQTTSSMSPPTPIPEQQVSRSSSTGKLGYHSYREDNLAVPPPMHAPRTPASTFSGRNSMTTNYYTNGSHSRSPLVGRPPLPPPSPPPPLPPPPPLTKLSPQYKPLKAHSHERDQLLVRQLPSRITEREVLDIFSVIGPVARIKLLDGKGCAYVEYEDPTRNVEAIRYFSGKGRIQFKSMMNAMNVIQTRAYENSPKHFPPPPPPKPTIVEESRPPRPSPYVSNDFRRPVADRYDKDHKDRFSSSVRGVSPAKRALDDWPDLDQNIVSSSAVKSAPPRPPLPPPPPPPPSEPPPANFQKISHDSLNNWPTLKVIKEITEVAIPSLTKAPDVVNEDKIELQTMETIASIEEGEVTEVRIEDNKPANERKRLFVCNFPKPWRDNDLKEYFEAFGDVTLANVRTEGIFGNGFVTFTKGSAAADAIEKLHDKVNLGCPKNLQVEYSYSTQNGVAIQHQYPYLHHKETLVKRNRSEERSHSHSQTHRVRIDNRVDSLHKKRHHSEVHPDDDRGDLHRHRRHDSHGSRSHHRDDVPLVSSYENPYSETTRQSAFMNPHPNRVQSAIYAPSDVSYRR